MLTPDGPWSFDAVALGGARALSSPRHDTPPFLAGPLPPMDTELIELGNVVRFVEHPCRAFLRTRLGISVRESLDEVQDALPVELGGLELWGVGQRLLDGLLAGAELTECVNAELARGSLPPAMLAAPVLDRVTPVVTALAAAAQQHGGTGPATSLDVNLRLPDGRTLAGTVPGVHGDTIRRASYSRVRPRDRLAAWVRLLALTAARPGEPFCSVVIGRARQGVSHAQTTVARVAALAPDEAVQHLAIIIDLYDRGMGELVPLACQASAAYAYAAGRGEDPIAAALAAWETTFGYDKEDREPEHLLAYGGALPFTTLTAAPPRRRRARRHVAGVRGHALWPLRPAAVGRAAAQRGAQRPMTATRPLRLSPDEFDLCGPLPRGVTVLEASAGTGKTYTIAALAARYVAEGMPLQEMLLITFTRMATGELRDRVRERLVTCEEQLSRTLDGVLDPGADEIVKLLATGSQEDVELRRDRLVRAIANFDAATIATTHGFCQEVLAELGTIGDLEPGTEFVEDVSELVEEVLDDLYVRRFQKHGGAPFDRAQALKIARAAVANPGNELEPKDAPKTSVAAMRFRLADAVRDELEHRKRQMAIMTYDDLLTRLNATLDPRRPSGVAAATRLRSRYRVVLVDEFQDTDPIQWQILRRAFVSDGVTLVLIADPKQAIYAFRGADVYAYLVAAATASTRATLPVNRRSDQALLDAYDALFADATLGHPEIVYRQVRAAPGHEQPRMRGAPDPAALRFRIVHSDEPGIDRTRTGLLRAPSAREHVARDLAADIVRLLSSQTELEQRSPDGTHD